MPVQIIEVKNYPPEGNYYFRVKMHTTETNMKYIDYTLEIPFRTDNETETSLIVYRLFIRKNDLSLIRNFTDCIGLTKEKGRMNVNLHEADNKIGVCILNKSGLRFYTPSTEPPLKENSILDFYG